MGFCWYPGLSGVDSANYAAVFLPLLLTTHGKANLAKFPGISFRVFVTEFDKNGKISSVLQWYTDGFKKCQTSRQLFFPLLPTTGKMKILAMFSKSFWIILLRRKIRLGFGRKKTGNLFLISCLWLPLMGGGYSVIIPRKRTCSPRLKRSLCVSQQIKFIYYRRFAAN